MDNENIAISFEQRWFIKNNYQLFTKKDVEVNALSLEIFSVLNSSTSSGKYRGERAIKFLKALFTSFK